MAVLYTTHYMEEAERLCDRVAIIDDGAIKAEGTRRELVSMVGQKDRIRVNAGGDLDQASKNALAINGVFSASPAEDGLEVLVTEASTILPELLSRLAAGGATISGVEVFEPNLEAVFLHLTGKALRD
jgi:ABC-2 type transport system ATP-binding protein